MASNFGALFSSLTGAAQGIGNALGGLTNFSLGGGKTGVDVEGSNAVNTHSAALWRENTKWFNQNGYKYLRQGLEDAGYNPLLAVGASPLSGANENAIGQKSSNWNIGVSRLATAQQQNLQSETNLNNAKVGLTSAEQGLKLQQTINEMERQDLIKLEKAGKKIENELKNTELKYKEKQILLDMQESVTRIQKMKSDAKAYQQMANAATSQAQAAHIQNKINAIQKQINREQLNINQDLYNLEKENSKYRNFGAVMGGLLSGAIGFGAGRAAFSGIGKHAFVGFK